jgi:16S rRNA (cytosine967-C5)-methyltransferase
MFLNSLLNHSAFLYKIARKSSQPADQILSEYFRKKKNIGSKERKFISELIFSLLRNELIAKHLLNIAPKDSLFNDINNIIYNDVNITYETELFLIYLLLNLTNSNFQYIDILQLLSKVSSIYNSKDSILKDLIANYKLNEDFITENNYISEFSFNQNNDEIDLSVIETTFSLPSFILEKLAISLDCNLLVSLANSLNFSALPCIRINNLAFKNSILEELSINSIPYELSALTPEGIILKKRINLNEFNFFKKGLAEVQDIGSQLIPYSLNPENNSRILDACAGAGGKSLQLAAMTEDTSEIIANDSDFSRMKELYSRANRAGFNSIKIKNLTKVTNFSDYYEYFDYILIDAPCSGLGTARRSPLLKYKLTQKSLDKLNNSQLEIINYYSKALKPGGVLVYATCSFLPDENRMIVDKFLSQNSDFEAEPLKPIFESNGIFIKELNDSDFDLTLYPHLHKSDGFYMARLKKL